MMLNPSHKRKPAAGKRVILSHMSQDGRTHVQIDTSKLGVSVLSGTSPHAEDAPIILRYKNDIRTQLFVPHVEIFQEEFKVRHPQKSIRTQYNTFFSRRLKRRPMIRHRIQQHKSISNTDIIRMLQVRSASNVRYSG